MKEYIDKMFEPTGYTYESSFFDSAFFNKLIVPSNTKELKSLFTDLLDVNSGFVPIESLNETTINLSFANENLKRSFTGNGSPNYTYTGTQETLNIKYNISGYIKFDFDFFNNKFGFIKIRFIKNSTIIKEYNYSGIGLQTININEDFDLYFLTNDTITFQVTYYRTVNLTVINVKSLKIKALNPILTDAVLNENILIKYSIPRNILQKDFFVWIMKMFNLYITEDKVKEKHLLIEPYVDYYDLSESKDWTYKVARDKPWNIKPMGMLIGKLFEYKYKDDNDFYNEGYKKKYNLPYGSRLEDTSFQFAKDKQTIEIGFSPSVLIQYKNTDKVVTAIYKKSSGNAVDQEERMDSNIRIMMAKKMTGVASWYIRNNDAKLERAIRHLNSSKRVSCSSCINLCT